MINCTITDAANGSKLLVTDVDTNKSMELNCTMEDFISGVFQYTAGLLMQQAFPFLNDGEREFLISGTTPEEWAKLFPEEEDEQDPEIALQYEDDKRYEEYLNSCVEVYITTFAPDGQDGGMHYVEYKEGVKFTL